jgi:glyoxylase-like metal-dependent hydrolase (beta-lactamase superfamily II)
MDYKIISSGSKGNCVIIQGEKGNVMFDCGVPFRQIKKELYDVKYLVLTHTHSDHINKKTLQLICEEFPKIKIIGNHEVHQVWNCNFVANAGYRFETDDYTFFPFECLHDVLCYGFVFEIDGQRIIYCTDTATMENAPDGPYDYFFIESNHDEKKLEKARNEYKGSYNPYLSGKRHLSTQAAKTFYFLHRRNLDSKFIELHKSERFY